MQSQEALRTKRINQLRDAMEIVSLAMDSIPLKSEEKDTFTVRIEVDVVLGKEPVLSRIGVNFGG